ncbi:MAG: endonuclease/exonuclease/phosphatase family protein [Promethearchaeota archaeon]
MKFKGKLLSINAGNAILSNIDYTYSLCDKGLAQKIAKKIKEINPDIICAQEIWTFHKILFGDKYEYIGVNDSIAVKKDFGKIIKNTYKSHCIFFKKKAESKKYPNARDKVAFLKHLKDLEENPYDGSIDSPYGIPASFDVSSIILKVNNSAEKILVVDVHLDSKIYNDYLRKVQIKKWIIEDNILRMDKLGVKNILIAGDFNNDEFRAPILRASRAMKSLLKYKGIKDGTFFSMKSTTNYIIPFKLDHIYGNARFSNYRISQSLIDKDFKELKKKYPISWWLLIDHKNLSVNFEFQ